MTGRSRWDLLLKLFNMAQFGFRLLIAMIMTASAEMAGELAVRLGRRAQGRRTPATRARPGLLIASDFAAINEPGFGDRWNSYPWSMQWWKGHLYVGTNRAFPCVEYYLFHRCYPRLLRYPPRLDPDAGCLECVFDLPLEAEIWRFTPETRSWCRVLQSPRDVKVPGLAGKSVPRDIGYRNMVLFEDPDGTEALYVAGVSSRPLLDSLPPPRLLRSADGDTFSAVPSGPGTVLGEIDAMGFRAMTRLRERLFVTAGGLYGPGAIYETRNPAGGNDFFQLAFSPRLRANNLAVLDDALYLGLHHPLQGYAVFKATATGRRPYKVTEVIPFGAHRGPLLGNSVMCMYVFDGALYVGTDAPAELVRIYPDGWWDLVVGRPRRTTQGMKYPLSGMGDGFDDPSNRLIQQMVAHDGWLYIGTYGGAGKQRAFPLLGPWAARREGFDLYATRDGVHLTAISYDGLGDAGNTVRTFASTPAGLFLGAIDERDGARVYLGSARSKA
jgi:hypothetical protein